MEKKLTAYHLKLIAIAAMLIDHVGWSFISMNSFWSLGTLTHVIGRLTAPIMCFFVAEGFYYTRNINKYIQRMGIFAVISAFAYSFYESIVSGIGFGFVGLGMIYTLFLGLLSLVVWSKDNWSRRAKFALLVLLCVLSLLGDWPVMGVLWVYFFGKYRDDKKQKYQSFCIVLVVEALLIIILPLAMGVPYWWSNIMQLSVVLAIPLLEQYNGQLGGTKSFKWVFYGFYPIHLIILGFIKMLM